MQDCPVHSQIAHNILYNDRCYRTHINVKVKAVVIPMITTTPIHLLSNEKWASVKYMSWIAFSTVTELPSRSIINLRERERVLIIPHVSLSVKAAAVAWRHQYMGTIMYLNPYVLFTVYISIFYTVNPLLTNPHTRT